MFLSSSFRELIRRLRSPNAQIQNIVHNRSEDINSGERILLEF
ncbi:hypothetical protein AM1_D0118 (plasmid) [Acaryochloris marina MBIC11017]|uniref:Uncharacterized protein n=1 Tax=Acaryochloris marina (strain MBIC 11017) TaxID=329726 RepID=A8ZNM7_ACAM1|nr:hypothetical protein AM1_D0118 [Acaryochloris marina MBIC11017]